MQKAIITGSTGLVGRAVTKYLLDQGVEVLCLGSRNISNQDIHTLFGRAVTYKQLPMAEIDKLPDIVESIGWTGTNGIVFYHFAWRGCHRLTDGDLSNQLKNTIFSANAVKAAKRSGCAAFIDSGTMEETFLECSLKSSHQQTTLVSSQSNYALAKLAARDMCNIVAYLEKIDYIHTRLSVPLDENLKEGTYVASSLNKIKNNEPYDLPTNTNFFDFIPVSEVAKAYMLIGEKGHNKSDYFLGTGNPSNLRDFFTHFHDLINTNEIVGSNVVSPEMKAMFSIESLQKDTGFTPQSFFQLYSNQIMDKMHLQNQKEDCR